MSNLHKGTLTVVVATVIASAMILLTGNSVADNEGQAKVETASPEKLQIKPESQTIEVIDKPSSVAVKKIPLAPPPGPFFSDQSVISAQKSLVAPVAPKAPINLSKQPSERANSLHYKIAPSLLKKPTNLVAEPKLSTPPPEMNKKMGDAPSIVQKPKQNSVPPTNETKKPEMRQENRPIWMQEENKVKQQGLNSQSKQANPQSQMNMGAPNIGWNSTNYPAQQYIYVPVPMMPSNMQPPQMPMFNGNVIPPSNYWGVPMAPSTSTNLMNNQNRAEKINAPILKGDK